MDNKFDKVEIIGYIKQNGYAEIPALQKKFGISYRDAKSVVSELLFKGDLKYEGGVRYEYVGKVERGLIKDIPPRRDGDPRIEISDIINSQDRSKVHMRELEERKKEILERLKASLAESGVDDDDPFDNPYRRILARYETDDNDDDEDETEYDEDDEDDIDDEIEEDFDADDEDEDDEDEDEEKEVIDFAKMLLEMELPDADAEEDDDDDDEDEDNSDDDEDENDDGSGSAGLGKEDRVDMHIAAPNVTNKNPKSVSEFSKIPIKSHEHPFWHHDYSIWKNEHEFLKEVIACERQLILSDAKMGLRGALAKAEVRFGAARDTLDARMAKVYERVIYDLKNMSPYQYSRLKKQYFGE